MTTCETTSTAAPAAAKPPGALRPGSGAMFDRIAERYDLLNRLMSMGLDKGWRRRTVRALDLRPGARILDLATGTAEMALEVLRQQPDATVIGVDPSPGMLERGRFKIREQGMEDSIELREGEAESLPFDDDSFDGLCIAYGIRNVADRPAGLREMARVIRPGGRVAILEATEARRGPMALGARFYVHQVVPRLGALLSGSQEYRSLQTSISAFPEPPDFAAMMEDCGLEVLEVVPITFGANTLFVGTPKAATETEGRTA
jgi:demethylmenaquinone methyltransferase/2-methoxy-6-polyprenyl-1,4-benzoquinol methylase